MKLLVVSFMKMQKGKQNAFCRDISHFKIYLMGQPDSMKYMHIAHDTLCMSK